MTDMVGSVIPMAYAQTRRTPNAADTRGQMFVELMGAAYRFDPQRTGPEGWASYAWMTSVPIFNDLARVRRAARKVSLTEGHRERSRADRALADHASLVYPTRAGVLEHAVAAITQALGQLPPSLREPLRASMQGHPLREIAEDLGYSESTAHRRIKEAREHIRHGLESQANELPWLPFDIGTTDPVLERGQRLSGLLVVDRGGSLTQGLVALRWDGCCDTSAQRTRTTSCDRAYVLAA